MSRLLVAVLGLAVAAVIAFLLWRSTPSTAYEFAGDLPSTGARVFVDGRHVGTLTATDSATSRNRRYPLVLRTRLRLGIHQAMVVLASGDTLRLNFEPHSSGGVVIDGAARRMTQY